MLPYANKKADEEFISTFGVLSSRALAKSCATVVKELWPMNVVIMAIESHTRSAAA